MTNKGCKYPGCTRPHHGHGYCRLHNSRIKVHGDPRVVNSPGPKLGSRSSADSVSSGDVFGRWTVTGSYERRGKNNDAYFPCRCSCGTEKYVLLRSLTRARKSGNGSCGCFRDERSKDVLTTHGRSRDRRARWLLDTYKMTLEDFDELLASQGGVCAICKIESEDLHVDHDHSCCPGRVTCGRCVRGILCQKCNHGIGNFLDNPATLETAASYLREVRHG